MIADDSIAISLRNVSKKYRLFSAPSERFKEALHPFRRKYHREFWALRDISFEVPKGTTVGIIGRNGSGKSTLLQLICSVLAPTSGTVLVHGKISALLELGVAFNPEFTGRENVLLTAGLMGISGEEIRSRLPLIEEFADIGEFFDQPVKTYSSGMFMRLAFANAVNVDPDILVIDEILAVGDAKFQHKCYRKIKDFQANGKTIVMVTHDIHAVLRHCDKALLIDHGAIIDAGQPQKVVRAYFDIIDGTASKQEQAGTAVLPTSDTFNDSFKANFHESLVEEFLRSIPERDNCVNRKSYNSNEVRQGVREAEIVDYLVICGDRCDPTTVQNGEIVHIYVKAIFHVATSAPIVGFEVQTTDGLVAYGWHNQLKKISITRLDPVTLIVFKISFVLRLAAGDYFVSLGLASETGGTYETRERRWGLIHLRVDATEHFGGLSDLGATGEEILRRKLG